jgi:hypothetical protein
MSQQLTKEQMGWLCLAVNYLQSNFDEVADIFAESCMEEYYPGGGNQGVLFPTDDQLDELRLQVIDLFKSTPTPETIDA